MNARYRVRLRCLVSTRSSSGVQQCSRISWPASSQAFTLFGTKLKRRRRASARAGARARARSYAFRARSYAFTGPGVTPLGPGVMPSQGQELCLHTKH